ncbi:hypothetical protein FRB90_003900 [Tulasnella sp. 427]|nr:hypothetical protein FRB90_003900 [Tulasnella sp. 427]
MQHNQPPNQDDGRRSRFAFDHPSAFGGFRESSLPAALRERAASQPPRGLTETLPARPDTTSRRFESPFGAPGTPPPLSAATIGPGSSLWSPARHSSFHMNNTASPGSATGVGVFPNPSRTAAMRSLSFSTSSDVPSRFQSFMRDSFPSTFEDDEDEYDVLTDINGLGNSDIAAHPAYNRQAAHIHSMSMSGTRDYTHPLRGTRAAALAAADNSSRSRSQSLAATNRRQLPLGMASSLSNTLPARGSAALMQDWGDLSGTSSLTSGGRSIPATNRAQGTNPADLSNMSPFVRDLDQILRDDINGLGSGILRDYWSGVGGREDGGGSGTTSRRHSVSVVQPRTRRSSTVAGFSGNGLVLGTAVEDEDDTSPPLRNMDSRRVVGGGRTAGLGGGYSGAGPFSTGRFAGGLGRSAIADDELQVPAVGNVGRPAGTGPGVLSHIQTNVGGQATGGKYPQAKSPVDRFHAQHQIHQAPNSAQSPTSASGPALSDLGRGVPLHRIASSTPMFIVEFKAGRSDIFFCTDPRLADVLSVGDLVIVEADRGKDLGTITRSGITGEDVETFQRMQMQSQIAGENGEEMVSPVRTFGKEIMPKHLYGKATQADIDLLSAKAQDEAKALQLCQGKVRAKKLPMEVVEAEYQWDRRKLTFYFVSDRRIDFRELVRELFRLYKTRIWMACLQGPSGSES